MKFSTKQDIEAPIDYVFARVTDFDNFERQGLRRGIEISREDPQGVPGLGSKWKIRAKFRGKPRNVASEICEFDPPSGLRVESESGGLGIDSRVQLLELSPKRTRLTATVDLNPHSLTGKLLVQSLKFAKSTLSARMAKRAGDFAKSVEEGYRNESR